MEGIVRTSYVVKYLLCMGIHFVVMTTEDAVLPVQFQGFTDERSIGTVFRTVVPSDVVT